MKLTDVDVVVVATSYAPTGEELISIVLIGNLDLDDRTAESTVRKELTGWFGLVFAKYPAMVQRARQPSGAENY